MYFYRFLQKEKVPLFKKKNIIKNVDVKITETSVNKTTINCNRSKFLEMRGGVGVLKTHIQLRAVSINN